MLKKSIICCLMIGAVALAVASSGGGDKKKADAHRKTGFTPIKTTNGFTLKAGPVYSGSQLLNSQRTRNYITQNSIVTYQKGNSVIILPHQSRLRTTATAHTVTNSTYRTNLNFLDFKIRLRLHK